MCFRACQSSTIHENISQSPNSLSLSSFVYYVHRLCPLGHQSAAVLGAQPQLAAPVVVRHHPAAIHHPEVHARSPPCAGAAAAAVVHQRGGSGTVQSALHQGPTAAASLPAACLLVQPVLEPRTIAQRKCPDSIHSAKHPPRGDCVIGIASFFLFFIQLCPAHPVRGRNSECVCAHFHIIKSARCSRSRAAHTHTHTRTVGIHTWRTRHKRECIEFCGWIDSDRREFHCGLRVDRFSGSQRRSII